MAVYCWDMLSWKSVVDVVLRDIIVMSHRDNRQDGNLKIVNLASSNICKCLNYKHHQSTSSICIQCSNITLYEGQGQCLCAFLYDSIPMPTIPPFSS